MNSLLTIVKMENSLSTPHCSFVMNLNQDMEHLPPFIQDFRAFFQKFPVNYELVAIHTDSAKNISILETLKKNAPPNESWQTMTSPHKSRAKNLKLGLDHARGEVLLFPSIVMATPLGDLFKVMQTLISEPEVAGCWGERYSKNSGALNNPQTKALSTEKVFNDIFSEKFSDREKDSLCEIGGIKKSAWQKIRQSAPIHKAKGWFLTAACQQALKDQALIQRTVFVNDSGARPNDYSLWKIRFELLRQGLF